MVARVAPSVQRRNDLLRYILLPADEWVVRSGGAAVLAHPGRHRLEDRHHRVFVREQFVGDAQRVQLLHRLRHRRTGERAHDRLGEGAVEREIDLRNPGGGRKTTLVRRIIAAEGANVVERSFLAAHDPVAARQVGVDRISALAFEGRFIEARRQYVDQVDVVGELGVFLASDATRDKDTEVADFLVNRVDDRLVVSAYVIHAVVEVERSSRAPAAAG